jgi:hypothetical protein
VNLEEYKKIRDTINNADVLMYKGTAWDSRIIRKIIRSKYSHAGIVAWWDDRLMVLEAVGRGVIVRPVSSTIKHYRGKVHLYSSKDTIPHHVRSKMVQFAQQELGKEYATWKSILLGFKILFKKKLDEKDKLKRANKLYCSHYVAQIYNSQGFDLKKDMSDRFMRPGDIANSPLLQRVK